MQHSGGVQPMNEAERKRISDYVEREFGIKMPAAKKSLLEGRLSKRLSVCKIPSYGGYFDFITKDPRGQDEYLRFADLVSTHETSFFRESSHFTVLANRVLPAVLARRPQGLELLSAACSTGEEAYTMAMVIDAGLRDLHSSIDFAIEGVDLSDRAVEIAHRGVYLEERIHRVPDELRRQYLRRSKDARARLCRVAPELRQKTLFHSGNLLSGSGFRRAPYDVIFCRNVLIYFDPANQRRVIASLLAHLKADGYLFLGHSETMTSLDMPLRSIDNAVYQKT